MEFCRTTTLLVNQHRDNGSIAAPVNTNRLPEALAA